MYERARSETIATPRQKRAASARIRVDGTGKRAGRRF